MAIQVRVLGPIEVVDRSGPVNLGGRTRTLIAALAARPGESVTVERLVEVVWRDRPPADPTGALQTLVSRLRAATAAEVVETAGNGYRLGPVELDSATFDRLLAEAALAEASEALDALDAALALWRGDAFADARNDESTEDEARRLDELRLVAIERRFRRLLELGRAEEVVGPLEAFVARHPLRERGLGLLLEALARTGREAEALRRYAEYRQVLAEETGLDPSMELQELELAILTRRLDPSPPPVGEPPPGRFPLVLRPSTVERRPGEPITWASVGKGAPLLYMPGWVSSLDTFADGTDPRASVVAELARHFEVFLFDRYGTGMSKADGPVDTSIEASTDEVRALLHRTGPETVLFASSASGPVAIRTAAANPSVKALVLLCTFASARPVFRNDAATESLLGLVRSSWGMGSRVLANLIAPGVDAEGAADFARFQRNTAPQEVAAGYLEQMLQAETTHLLGAVEQPALIVHYRADPAIPFEGARQLARGLPNAELVTLDGPFHIPPPAHVERIAQLTSDFLARNC